MPEAFGQRLFSAILLIRREFGATTGESGRFAGRSGKGLQVEAAGDGGCRGRTRTGGTSHCSSSLDSSDLVGKGARRLVQMEQKDSEDKRIRTRKV